MGVRPSRSCRRAERGDADFEEDDDQDQEDESPSTPQGNLNGRVRPPEPPPKIEEPVGIELAPIVSGVTVTLETDAPPAKRKRGRPPVPSWEMLARDLAALRTRDDGGTAGSRGPERTIGGRIEPAATFFQGRAVSATIQPGWVLGGIAATFSHEKRPRGAPSASPIFTTSPRHWGPSVQLSPRPALQPPRVKMGKPQIYQLVSA
jgi:hypothetical protein